MRALKILTIVMAIMIVGGTTLLGVLIARRVSTAPANAPTPAAASLGAVILHEPPGTRITAIAPAGTALAIALQGGGPDRVLILDPTTLKTTGRISLPQ